MHSPPVVITLTCTVQQMKRNTEFGTEGRQNRRLAALLDWFKSLQIPCRSRIRENRSSPSRCIRTKSRQDGKEEKIEQKASLALYKYYTLRVLWKKQSLEFNVSQICPARSCVSNDIEWMLKESDFEVKLKMDGRLRRFADEADSIDNADPQRKGAPFPATCKGTALPFSSRRLQFRRGERGSAADT